MPTRRRLLQMLGAASVLGAGGWLLSGGGRANAYYSGAATDHFDGHAFFNPDGTKPHGIGKLLRWHFGGNREAWPESFPSPFPADRPPPRHDGDGARIVYIGHASFLVQTRGLNLLIDPVWAERASPYAFIGPKRVNAPGIAFEHLPKIDAVLVTHNHYDHMDLNAVGQLWQRYRPQIVTPLGNDAILKGGAPGLEAKAVDWGQSVDLGSGVVVHAEQTTHWSARGLWDRMHALWASFVLQVGPRKIYSVGDTSFSDGSTFKTVAQRHPGLDLALLPIGSYEPRWFMSTNHINPEEAIAALQLCGAKAALGHHWGTFRLTNEGVERPAQDLAAALAKHAIAPERFAALRPGEVRMLA